MSNPYYIPPGEAPLSGLTRNIMALAEMKQRGDLARMGMEMDQKHLDQTARQIEIDEGNQQLNREKFGADRPDLVKYDANTHVKARTFLNHVGLGGSSVETFLNDAQKNGLSNGQVHAVLRTPQMHAQIKEHITNQLIKGQETPGFMESQQGQYLTSMLEGIDSPDDYDAFIDSVFPEVAQYNRTMETEARKNGKWDTRFDDRDQTWKTYFNGQEVESMRGQKPQEITKAEIEAGNKITSDGRGGLWQRINGKLVKVGQGNPAAGSGGYVWVDDPNNPGEQILVPKAPGARRTTPGQGGAGRFTPVQIQEIETKINSNDSKITPSQRQTYIRNFNENAETPYFYAMTDGENVKAYKLPEIPDDQNPGQVHQVTPRDITDTFRHYQKQGTKIKGADGKTRPITWADCYRIIVKKSQI